MTLQSQGGINRLPVQLRAHILQHMETKDSLSFATVSSMWRAAAALSTRDISMKGAEGIDDLLQVASLSSWLEAHSAEAPIHSITVDNRIATQLLLPVQQLKLLRKLNFKNVEVRAAAQDEADKPLLAPALTALTSLDLHGCDINMQGLASCTSLQRLALHAAGWSAEAAASNSAAVVEALPHLLRLTALELKGTKGCQDAAVSQISALTALQDLELSFGSCSASAFAQLPSSLTRLVIQYPFGIGHGAQVGTRGMPALLKLTALQELVCDGIGSFHCAVLTALTGLTKLKLWAADVSAPQDEPRLVVLSALTRLQHLELLSFDKDSPPAVEVEDFAAIASSDQLTTLRLGAKTGIESEQADAHMFFREQPRPNLRTLSFEVDWLTDPILTEHIVSGCPNLERVQITPSSFGPMDDAGDAASLQTTSLSLFTGLTALTSLEINGLTMRVTASIWAAIASLSSLRKLDIIDLDANDLGGMMHLTACRQLTCVSVHAIQPGHPDPAQDGSIHIHTIHKGPEDSSPEVWQQIPCLVLSAAIDHFEAFLDASPEVLHSLMRAAARASSFAVQRQVALEQDVRGLQQQVADMRDGLAAVLAHLKLPGCKQ